MPSRRQERINGRLVKEVSEIFQSLKDPRIGFITITGCTVSADLRNATVRFSVLGDPEKEAESIAAVKNSVGHVQRVIGGRLEMKRTPHLSLVYDRGLEHIDLMSQVIAEARASDPNLSDDADDTAEPEPGASPTIRPTESTP